MSWMVPAAQKAHATVGNFILVAIFGRLMQHGRALQSLANAGYADEAQSLARGMVNAAADLLFIDQADTDARALLYGLFSQKRRRRWASGLVTHGFQSKQQVAEWDKTETEKEDEALAQHEKSGVRPAARVGDANTWTGLKDDQLIKLVGRSDWYDLYYVPFSDATHASVLGAAEQITRLSRSEVEVGPRVDPRMLQLVIMASVDTLAKALYQLDGRFNLGKKVEIEAAVQKVHAALKAYVATKAEGTAQGSSSTTSA
jgi:hypothetical protein